MTQELDDKCPECRDNDILSPNNLPDITECIGCGDPTWETSMNICPECYKKSGWLPKNCASYHGPYDCDGCTITHLLDTTPPECYRPLDKEQQGVNTT